MVSLALMAFLTSCGSPAEEASTSGEAGGTVAEPGAASLDGLELAQAHAAELVEMSSAEIVVVDGLFPTATGSHLRVMTAEPSANEVGAVWEYSEFGPLGSVSAVKLGDEVVVAGQRCPEPYNGADAEGPVDNESFCGSLTWDVIAVNPATGSARILIDGIELAADDGVEVKTATERQIFVKVGERVLVMDGEGSSIEGPALELGGDQILEPGSVCALGEDFVAIRPVHYEDAGVNGPMRNLNDFFEASRWTDDGSWEQLSLPSTDVTARAAFSLGCGTDGHLFNTVSSSVVDGELVESVQRAASLGVADGRLGWSELPVGDLPESAAPPTIQELGGHVSVGVLEHVPSEASEPRPAEMFVWIGGQWVQAEVSGDEAYDVWPPTIDVVVTESAVLTYTQPEGGPFDPATVVVTG